MKKALIFAAIFDVAVGALIGGAVTHYFDMKAANELISKHCGDQHPGRK